MNNSKTREAVERGRSAHDQLAAKVEAKKSQGWTSEKALPGRDGNFHRHDALKPDGSFLELKSNSRTGIAAGERQAARYVEQLKRSGEVIYYDSKTGEPLYDLG